MKTIQLMTAGYIAGGEDSAQHSMDHPRRKAPRVGRRDQEDEDFSVSQRMEGMDRKIDFLVELQMKLAALVVDKLHLDVFQLP